MAGSRDAGGLVTTAGNAEEAVTGGTEEAPQPAPARTAAPVRVTFSVSLDAREEESMRAIVDAFNETNLYGITVEMRNTYTDAGAEETPDGDLAESAPAGADVALVSLAEGMPDAFYVSVNNRVAMDFENYTDIPENLRALTAYQGAVTGVPFDLNPVVFYYNKTLFEEYELEAPVNWELMEKAGKTLSGEEGIPVAVTDNLTAYAEMLFLQNGVSLTDGNHAGFSNRDGEAALDYLMRMLNEDALLLADPGTCRELFLSGQTAGYFGYATDLREIYRHDAFTLDACPVAGGANAGAPCDMRMLMLFATGESVQEAAWKWIKYLTSADVNAAWAVDTGRVPVRQSAIRTPVYQTYTEYSVSALAASAGTDVCYLPRVYSDDLRYRVREIIGRNRYSDTDGRQLRLILEEEINDSLAQY